MRHAEVGETYGPALPMQFTELNKCADILHGDIEAIQ